MNVWMSEWLPVRMTVIWNIDIPQGHGNSGGGQTIYSRRIQSKELIASFALTVSFHVRMTPDILILDLNK